MQTDTGCSGAWFGRRGETQITEGAAQKGTLQNKGLWKSPVLSCLGRRPGGGSGGQGEKVVPQPNCVPWCLRDFLVSRGTGHVQQEPRSGWRVFCQASAPHQEEEVKNMTLRLGESLLSNNTFTTQRLHTSATGPATSGEPWSNHHLCSRPGALAETGQQGGAQRSWLSRGINWAGRETALGNSHYFFISSVLCFSQLPSLSEYLYQN